MAGGHLDRRALQARRPGRERSGAARRAPGVPREARRVDRVADRGAGGRERGPPLLLARSGPTEAPLGGEDRAGACGGEAGARPPRPGRNAHPAERGGGRRAAPARAKRPRRVEEREPPRSPSRGPRRLGGRRGGRARRADVQQRERGRQARRPGATDPRVAPGSRAGPAPVARVEGGADLDPARGGGRRCASPSSPSPRDRAISGASRR